MAENTIRGPVIGVDEAGRGPVLGPLVVAAVLCGDQEDLARLGVRDSKQLTPGRREELAILIQRICRVGVVMIPAEEIDTRRRTMTLNEIEVEGFSRAITEVLAATGDETAGGEVTIILDAADVNEDRFGRDIELKLRARPGSVTGIVSRHRADEHYPVVSAASIIAKTRRDGVIRDIARTHGEIGSGYPADPVTKRYLETLFREGRPIPPFVRRSWDTMARLTDRAANRTLEDFF